MMSGYWILLKILLHLMRWSCAFCIWISLWLITLVDLHILSHLCICRMKSTLSWWTVFWMCPWVQFPGILCQTFVSLFYSDLLLACHVFTCFVLFLFLVCLFICFVSRDNGFIKTTWDLFCFTDLFEDYWCSFFFDDVVEICTESIWP